MNSNEELIINMAKKIIKLEERINELENIYKYFDYDDDKKILNINTSINIKKPIDNTSKIVIPKSFNFYTAPASLGFGQVPCEMGYLCDLK